MLCPNIAIPKKAAALLRPPISSYSKRRPAVSSKWLKSASTFILMVVSEEFLSWWAGPSQRCTLSFSRRWEGSRPCFFLDVTRKDKIIRFIRVYATIDKAEWADFSNRFSFNGWFELRSGSRFRSDTNNPNLQPFRYFIDIFDLVDKFRNENPWNVVRTWANRCNKDLVVR